mmetsp:Transcript_920/g.1471  ORF Transcript_920/g.1471 Transcript_920/m.1471 type:complete len:185 (+) Transcript_920:125-679(+)|eukprot:CAMPEP_0179464698 /NCGR_PEP_ID=MMETSP0799-20121207/46453_1 /TAXON_ID=46947 /ORGANISM="Geminigera cryophila, Strain CCMP2564" /LENGTH=184 /DNA_ID=CAMNT_0021268619 /DNA_START=123 /DNA_END=677 /DNA_ORIENTATION=-
MSTGMSVVVHELRNRLQFNGLRGHVQFVREDDRLCVRLNADGKLLLLRAENVRQWFSPAGIARNVQTMEFVRGTSEQEVAAFFRTHALDEDTEICTLLRPVQAPPSANMSTEFRALLIQSARLEHMGSLSPTAKLLGWVVSPENASGCTAYVNESLLMAVPSTYDLYMNPKVACRVVHAADESF